MRASYFHFACCKYVPTILSESLAQARVAGTLRAKTERKIWITYSGVPSLPRAITGMNVLIHFAEKNVKYHYIMFSNSCNCKRVNCCIKSGSTGEIRSHWTKGFCGTTF